MRHIGHARGSEFDGDRHPQNWSNSAQRSSERARVSFLLNGSNEAPLLLKVLIAEDELMIADVIEEALITNGYEVCGIAATVDEAVALGEKHKPDLAVLDVRLAKGGLGPDIARRLEQQGKNGVLLRDKAPMHGTAISRKPMVKLRSQNPIAPRTSCAHWSSCGRS